MVAGEYATLDPPKIVDLVAKEKEFYNYIYPLARVGFPKASQHRLKVVQVGVSVNNRLLKRSQPYRNQRIINVIRSVYFTGGPSSLARRFDPFFPRHTDSEGVKSPEMPKPLLALVATAVRFHVSCFNVNAYLKHSYTRPCLIGKVAKRNPSTLQSRVIWMSTTAISTHLITWRFSTQINIIR